MSYFPKRNIPTVSEWEAFTPTCSWTQNTTATGKYRKVGNILELQYKIELTGNPNSASLTVTIPEHFTVDTNEMLEGETIVSYPESMGYILDSGVGYYPFVWGQLNTTNGVVSVTTLNLSSTPRNYRAVGQNVPITWASGDKLYFTIRFPVV